MIIAEEKRHTNIAEYILYMWQVEDIIRAYQFNIDLIELNIISQYKQTDKIKQKIKDWFVNLILMMLEEGIKEKGHMKMLNRIIQQLDDLHSRIIEKEHDIKYSEHYESAKPNIEELRSKLPNKKASDIETCFNGLYGLLLMRLKKREVSDETKKAMSTFSSMLSILSERFKLSEEGKPFV